MAKSNAALDLASSINYELRGLSVIAKINKELRKAGSNIVLADDGDNKGLQVLKHGDAARLAMQIYQEYVSDTDYTYFVNFVQQLDSLVFKFRGNQPLNLEDMDDEEEEPPRKKGKNKFGGKPVKRINPPKSSDDEGDDEGGSDEDNSVVISKVVKEMLHNNRKTNKDAPKILGSRRKA